MSPCFYHPDASAVAGCARCGVMLCDTCRNSIGGSSYCKSCAPMAASMSSTMPTSSGPQASQYGGGTATLERPIVDDRPETKQVLLGMAAALGASIVLSIIAMKILFYAQFSLAYVYVLVGYGIGFVMHKIIGRGGSGYGLAAAGLMALGLLVGHAVFTLDVVGTKNLLALQLLPQVMAQLGAMHWICIAIGLFACYRAMERQEG